MTDVEKLLDGINLSGKKIRIDNTWYSSEELKETIKKMIDSGDYEISKYADSLKRIEKVIKEFQEVSVKIPVTTIESFEKRAKETSKPVEILYMQALINFIEGPVKKDEPVKKEPEEPKKDEPLEKVDLEEKSEENAPAEKPAEKEEEKSPKPEEPKPEEEEDKKRPPKVVRVACHNCKRPITITTAKRPITVVCEHCGARGQLSS
jgi:hypothetical protein